jgi:hypothetical protein
VTFADFVSGRTVAIVGPAPAPYDQSAEVEAHDLVYRCHRPEEPLPGYGTRTDIAFLNGQHCRQVHDDEFSSTFRVAREATWWVMKAKGHRPHGLAREVIRPTIPNPNAVTAALFDLLKHDPKTVSVYGTDLYASGPDNAYHPAYGPRSTYSLQVQARGVINHKPATQRRVHRWALSTGKVVGDDRYLEAVTMSDEEYQTVIDRWTALVPKVEQHA